MKKSIFSIVLVLCTMVILSGVFFSQSSMYVLNANGIDYYSPAENSTVLDESKNVLDMENYEGKNVATIIENELQKLNTDVVSEINKQADFYEEQFLSASSTIEKQKLLDLVNNYRDMASDYQSQNFAYKTSSLYGDPVDFRREEVITMCAYFASKGYDLASELLGHAYYNKDINSEYTPINCNRVISSKLTYDIAYGNLTNSRDDENIDWMFPNSGSCNERDLYYAIKHFDFTKPSPESRVIYFEDPYDYAYIENPSTIEDWAISFMYSAQEAGYIVPYQVKFAIDVSEILRLSVEEKESSTWYIRVFNPSSSEIELVYNSKMCNKEDAQNWTGLTDIVTCNINANDSEVIKINENGLATHIAVSYIKQNERFVTDACELNIDGNNLSSEFFKRQIYIYRNISLIGKNSKNWLLRLTNNYSEETIKIEYNAKMCYEDDAKDWTGLSDIHTVYISKGKFADITISENWSATHIAIRFIGEDEGESFYANELDPKGTMKINSYNYPIYKYLIIANVGKEGNKWKIRISNPLSHGITITYNAKMCNEGDAQNWTGLNDKVNIYSEAYQSQTVYIQENWFATSIAVSYYNNGKRLITYANGLNNSGGINIKYNYK